MFATRRPPTVAALLLDRLHEPLGAVARFDDLVVGGSETRTDMADAVFAKSATGNDGNLLRREQASREFLLRQAGRRDARERIERPTR